MILAKTPLRLPLAGGLSDLKEYADENGGLTLSATIDKFIYIAIKNNYAGDFELHYLNTHEKVAKVDQIRHNHIREAIKMTRMEHIPLDLSIMNDMPHEGGLGSSGALSAALFTALYAFKGEPADNERIIAAASTLEMEVLEGASGYHDHTITQLGGFRLIKYHKDGYESVPMEISEDTLTRFKRRFMLFYSGYHAKTKPSLVLLAENLHLVFPEMEAIKMNALDLVNALKADDIFAAGECIQRQQNLKQNLPGHFENEYVIKTMRRARKLGVHAQIPGGKIGSFLIVFRPKGMPCHKVIRHFSELQHVPFNFVHEGTRTTSL